MTLLSPAFLSKLEGMQVQSRHKLLGRFGGEHRSRRYGNAVDFADFREYSPGDDFRRIDYNQTLTRLDQTKNPERHEFNVLIGAQVISNLD